MTKQRKTEEEIRADWGAALRSIKRGEELSASIGWGFCDEDLHELARLHQEGKFRLKIEDLLTNCNFHKECSMMAAGDYSRF